jgi:CRP-like cAMP-binding protein
LQNQFPDSFIARFKETINAYSPVPDEAFDAFLATFEMRTYKKGEVLLRHGEICRHLYFILEGGIRCFHFDEQGREVNIHFYFENELASEFKSLRMEEPSARNLVTITASKLLRSTKRNYIPVFEQYPAFANTALRFFQERFLSEEEHSDMLRKLTAEERYQYVMDEQPHLLQRISLTQLSSWLGISRESLSRIRAKITG